MTDIAKIKDLHHTQKNNCCQCVVRYFADQLDIDEVTLLRVSEGFGLGCGGMDSMCGALSGAIILAGIKNSDASLFAHRSNGSTYALSKEMTRRFYERAGSLTCRDIKGTDTGRMLLSCDDCIIAGVEIAADVLGLSL